MAAVPSRWPLRLLWRAMRTSSGAWSSMPCAPLPTHSRRSPPRWPRTRVWRPSIRSQRSRRRRSRRPRARSAWTAWAQAPTTCRHRTCWTRSSARCSSCGSPRRW
eukprot:Mycagemm_TRINITY_DN9569_c0_g1::TRINITY_DN9569_c0_g1_i1::g.1551::m.1551 type:complete len:105 gc:universal TRINITY_DN9569_c0_g1_i1:543-229(-)